MLFRTVTLSLFCLVFTGSAVAQLEVTRAADIAWKLEGDFCEPETVLPLPNNTFLVSNVCGFKKKGNGYLSIISADGTAIDWRAVTGLDAPLGMALHNNQIFVVDSNRVRVFDWPEFTPVKTIDLDTGVANDLAIAADGTIYVSDSARHRVVRRDPDGSQTVLLNSDAFRFANGMAIDGDYLYVGGERLWCVYLPTGTIKNIGSREVADIDGIEFETDGTIQLGIVGGPLVRLPVGKPIEVIGGEGVSSTNHGYFKEQNLSLIPTGYDNTVIAIRL